GNKLQQPVKMTKKTIFDLASVTKVMGTTQGIMKLASEGVIDIHEPVATYIPEFAENGKDAVKIAHLLTHTSGLTPWAPTFLHATNPAEVLDYI
ncbi:beta-lactamase family protein, partial [Microvirga sp. 3-52]|nr:beta-lactamase family protein [Microvirga sp. 3-52]